MIGVDNYDSKNPRDFAVMQLLLQTGIKLSELNRLTVGEVELPSVSQPSLKDSGYLHIAGGEQLMQLANISSIDLRLQHLLCLSIYLDQPWAPGEYKN